MKVEILFYTFGALFLLGTVIYFTYEYLFNLSRITKTIILVCLVALFFLLGEVLRERCV